MKKFFCFHCQQDVSPYNILKWRICPHCYKLMSDDGSGFYRVCEVCGANMPSDGEYCLKCGHNLQGGEDKNLEKEKIMAMCCRSLWTNYFMAILLIIPLFFVILGIFYISFYFVLFGVVFAVFAALLNYIRRFLLKK